MSKEMNTGWQGQFDGAGGLDANKRPLTNEQLEELNREFDMFEAHKAAQEAR